MSDRVQGFVSGNYYVWCTYLLFPNYETVFLFFQIGSRYLGKYMS